MAEFVTRQDAAHPTEQGMIRDTVRNLLRLMQRRLTPAQRRDSCDTDSSLSPDDYLVIDVETTGVDTSADLIGQIGHCLVKGRKVVDQGGFVLNWTTHPGINQYWLQERLLQTRYHVEHDRYGQPSGKHYQLSYELLAEQGADPLTVLRQYLDWFQEIRTSGMFFVAHNGYHFDAAILQSHFSRWLQSDWHFNDHELFDTGMVCKASQSQLTPWAQDTVRDFSLRVYRQRLRGVFWSLDGYCVPHYLSHLDLDMKRAHEAGYDCYLCHLLFEHWRDLAEGKQASAAAL